LSITECGLRIRKTSALSILNRLLDAASPPLVGALSPLTTAAVADQRKGRGRNQME